MRLLLLTVAVCAVVLLLLARLRFPAPPAVDTTAPPLERLAARASYDALAADIQRVEPMIAPNLIVLRVAPQFQGTPRNLRDVLALPDSPSGLQHVAALRLSADTALAPIDPGARIEGIVGGTAGVGSAAVLAVDSVRRIARIRVPEAPARELPQLPLASLPTPVYVVVVEGTQAGVTLRPVFLGRGDRFDSPRWERPLLPLGGIGVAPGALLFSLAGEFIGTAVVENGAPAIVGARDVLDAVEKLASTPMLTPADLGIAVQSLTPPLAAALAAQRGVVVSEVDAEGAAGGRLEPSDVITAVDDWSPGNPDEFLLRLASRPAGATVTVTVIRNGESLRVPLALGTATANLSGGDALTFTAERGVGTRVAAASEVSGAGLRPGDIVTYAGGTAAPTPAQLRRLLARPTPSGLTTVVVLRDGRQRVVAVPVAGRIDAATR